jgi:hypothetical protein
MSLKNVLTLLALITTTALRAVPPAPISLAGEWRFALDRSAEQQESGDKRYGSSLPPGDGIVQEWFKRDLPDRIQLPGILQSQGFGNDISLTTPWVLGLGDAWWKLQPASLREHFSQPGHVEVPFLSQPPKHYLGAAWYQRDIEIPATWRDQRAVLFIERPHWETTVWIDEKAYPANNSLVAPHVFDLGILTPGKHRLTLRIDNRRIVAEPGNNGHADDGHSVSDALGASWNGAVGRIELSATSPVWIDDAQVFPNIAKKTALIKVKIGNVSGQPGTGTLSIGKNASPASWDETGGQAEIEVPLGANIKTWDEFHPELQKLSLVLTGPQADDAMPLTFGLREVTAQDKDLLINGRIVNLRTTHFGGDFPLTGYPATDVDSWKKIIRVCKEYGLNGIRFHSWCPPDAAFVAADELGFYLQPECGLWTPFSAGSAFTQLLELETARLLKAFGNHPSFILLSPANEPGGDYVNVTPQWAAAWYAKDNRRLYSAGTGWNRPRQVTGGAQFATLVRYGTGELRNVTGWFGRDNRKALENVHIPVFAHEIGQWCAYPDFEVIKEFTGYMRPSNYNIFKYIAEQQGVLEYNALFSKASGLFQLACYKEEIEANLRTPGLAGFQLLDLRDYLGQGTALIGVVDAFWRPKGYVSAKEFRRFNSSTVPLARLEQRVYTTSDTFSTEVEIYHFSGEPITSTTPYWKIVDSAGHTAAEGNLPKRDIPIGKNIPLGRISLDLSKLSSPETYRLVVGLLNTPVENEWRFWLYPAQIDPSIPASMLLTRDWAAAEARLAQGGSVLFVPTDRALDPAKCPPLQKVPVFWNIQMTVRPPQNPNPRFDAMLGLACDPKHPALASFPTGINCDWQWTPLINDVRSVNLSEAPRELKPIVAAIDDWNRNWRLGVIFECKVGPGKLLVSVVDLTNANAPLGAKQLRRSLLNYMDSDRFRPAATLTVDQVRKLWLPSTVTPPIVPIQRALDPDLDDGSRPRQAPKAH